MPDLPQSSHPPEASPYASHLPALDGVRGLAVLGVMGSHLLPGNTATAWTRFARFVLGFGATGVDLFFVLSGFLITGILFDSLGEQRYFRLFYARRALRIFPLYYGVLAVFGVAALLRHLYFHGQLLSLALFLQNTGLVARPIYAYAGPPNLPLSHFWSLAIEEQFYIAWSLLVFQLRSRRRLLLVCGCFLLLCPVLRAMLLLHGWGYYPVHNNTALRADALLAGGSLAFLLRSRFHNRVLRLAPWAALAGGLLTALLLGEEAFRTQRGAWWPSVALSLRYSTLALLFTGLLGLSLRRGLTSHLCRLAGLRFFGRYSYGLYVLHLILFSYAELPLRHWIALHLTANKLAGVLLTGACCFAGSILAALASFHLYEKRFLRLKRFLPYRARGGEPLPLRGEARAAKA